ncbi:MAG: glycosyltransferase family 2 protein [Chloroflexi bacterium]|nr:glycosyltransferase family 2 protein [Chloroflexota bacterium]
MSGSRLSVIIVNYNGGAIVRLCLDHLWPQLRPDWDVTLVDNASPDRSADGLEDRFPGLSVVNNPRNVGFARANNQAIPRTAGDYVLLLNPDVVITPGALETALAYMDANPDVSILGPRILLPDGRLDPAAHRSFKTPATYFYRMSGLSRWFPRHRSFGHYYLTYLDENAIADVDSVVGAFLLIRRSVIDEIGLLDERFFMYCEDEDWCWRAKQAGGRVVYHPGVVVHHRKGSSSRTVPFRMAYQWHRSLYLYHRKNIAPRYTAATNALVYAGIAASLAAKLGVLALKRLWTPSLPSAPPVPSGR